MSTFRQPTVRSNMKAEADEAVIVSRDIPDVMTHSSLGENIGRLNVFLNSGTNLDKKTRDMYVEARDRLSARADVFKKARTYKPSRQRWYYEAA